MILIENINTGRPTKRWLNEVQNGPRSGLSVLQNIKLILLTETFLKVVSDGLIFFPPIISVGRSIPIFRILQVSVSNLSPTLAILIEFLS
jgi:hypothetical protein